MRSRHQDRAPGFVGSGPASLVGASARDNSAARMRLLREVVALCRLHGLTFSEALDEYEASRV